MSFRSAAKVVAAVIAVAAFATAAIAFIGISVDAQRWRAPRGPFELSHTEAA